MTKRLLALLLFATTLRAHEGVHEQIAETTRRIAAEPRNAALRLERAELYRLHREWKLARADYDAAAKLDPALPAIEFARGRMEVEAGSPQRAKVLLDRFLAANPAHAAAHRTRARALVQLRRTADAVADYDAAIAHTDPPNPDLYYERAELLAAAGETDVALRGLDEGVARLGNLVSLQREAIRIALAAARYEEALRRLDQLAATAEHPERYAAERAEIAKAVPSPR